jgi:hypothetical protein
MRSAIPPEGMFGRETYDVEEPREMGGFIGKAEDVR